MVAKPQCMVVKPQHIYGSYAYSPKKAHQIHTGNWKQTTVEMETGNGKWKQKTESQNLMQINAVQRPHKNYIPLQMTEISCYRDHLYVKTTFQQRIHLPVLKSSPMRACFLIESMLGEMLQVV